jgi:glycosyltransferase involved in cell wall biosynthesis
MTGSPREKHVLITTDAVGGVWVHSTQMAQALTARGWHVSVITLGPAPSREQLLPIIGNPKIDIEITNLELEWQDPEGHDHQRALDYLTGLGRRLDPDIVHLNSFREALAVWRAPVVVTAHSCVRSWWHACRGGEPREARWTYYAAQVEAGLNAADAWTAPTAAFRDTMAALYNPARPGIVIRNGIHERGTAAPVAKEPFILAAGRLWDEAKNIAILPKAAEGTCWPVQVVGAVQEKGSGLHPVPISGPIEWLGELPHGALLHAMERASIFVAPAFYEPFGLGVLEAASKGCALVLADIPTFRELWDGAALFVDPRDPKALITVLNTLAANDGFRRCFQDAARRRSSRYSLDAQVAAYEQIYAELAGVRVAVAEGGPAGMEAVA